MAADKNGKNYPKGYGNAVTELLKGELCSNMRITLSMELLSAK